MNDMKFQVIKNDFSSKTNMASWNHHLFLGNISSNGMGPVSISVLVFRVWICLRGKGVISSSPSGPACFPTDSQFISMKVDKRVPFTKMFVQ